MAADMTRGLFAAANHLGLVHNQDTLAVKCNAVPQYKFPSRPFRNVSSLM